MIDFVACRAVAMLAMTGALCAGGAVFAQAALPPTQPAGSAPKSTATPPAAAAPVYDENADARQQIAAALVKAKKNNQRVLIQWGGNWCGWCIKLNKLCKENPEIAKKLLYEYQVVHVDTGKPAGKNVDLAKSLGAALNGFPFLTVLDADGLPLANQETSSLETKEQTTSGIGHDPKLVMEFLTKHQTAHPEAQELLEAGLLQAKAENKRVFLHFGAPWCGWCHKLEEWMGRPDVSAILGKDFVDVKIDIDRTIGGSSIVAKYNNGSPKTGLPWIVFLDGHGNAMINGNGPKGNIGFPQEPAEIAHFQAMIAKAARKISESELQTIVNSLTAKEKAGVASQ
jgi:thiol:disulfide interchange protein